MLPLPKEPISISCVRFLTNYDVVKGKYDVGESWWNYLVCTKNKNLDRNQHTRDYYHANAKQTPVSVIQMTG